MVTWSRLDDPQQREVWMCEAPDADGSPFKNPDVKIRIVRERDHVERLIVAFFRYDHQNDQVLLLRNEMLPNVAGAVRSSKMLALHEWAEQLGWGEGELLREMWALPLMANVEREQMFARDRKRVKEARERASKLIAARKNKRR
jgi:hypothetical protein